MDNTLIQDNKIRRCIISLCVSSLIGCILLSTKTYETLTLVKCVFLFIICFDWGFLCNSYLKERTETRNNELVNHVCYRFAVYCVENNLIRKENMLRFQDELEIYTFGKVDKIIYIQSKNGLLYTVEDNYSKFVPVVSKRN